MSSGGLEVSLSIENVHLQIRSCQNKKKNESVNW